MANVPQFLRGQPIRSVVVIAGRNNSLVRYALDVLLSRQPDKTVVVRRNASDIKPKRILAEAGAPMAFYDKTVIIYEDCQLAKDGLEVFEWYAQNPTDGVMLILTANSLRREDGERWIPSTEKVLYIDCGNLTEDNLVQIGVLTGMTEDDSLWLVNRCLGDIDEIIRCIELMQVFSEKPTGLIKKIVSNGQIASGFAKYGILDTGNVSSLIKQLRNRFIQLIHMSVALAARANMMDVAKRADIEPFVASKLFPVAKGTTPNIWLEKLAAIIPLEPYAARGYIGVREALELLIKN